MIIPLQVPSLPEPMRDLPGRGEVQGSSAGARPSGTEPPGPAARARNDKRHRHVVTSDSDADAPAYKTRRQQGEKRDQGADSEDGVAGRTRSRWREVAQDTSGESTDTSEMTLSSEEDIMGLDKDLIGFIPEGVRAPT